MNLGKWEIDDFLTFTCNTHTALTGAATDADAVPTYRVYEDETGTPLLTGSMAKLDDTNTTGFYSEQIQLTAANGFEVGKAYTIYISATVDSVVGTLSHSFQMEVEKASAAALATVDGVVDDILVDTGTTLPAEHATLATAAALSTHDGKLDTVDTVVDAIKAVTDLLPDGGALTTIDANIDAILVDTGTTLPAEHATLATAAALATHDGKLDTVDTVVDAIKAVTDNLPDSGQLLDLALILTDTGTTLPAEHALLATAASIAALNDLSSADVAAELATYDGPTRAEATSDKNEILADTGSIEGKVDIVDTNVDAILVDTGTTIPGLIAALNDLSSADVQTVLETNDLDHLLKVAHPSGDPVASTIFDLIMNKDVSQTFDRADDSLEAISDGESTAPSAADVADAVWEEAAGDHTTSTTFGGKNQKVVPSETINDYKADVSGLATSAALATVDAVVDAIKAVTDLLPDAGALNDLAAILVDTGTTLPAAIAALNDLAAADIQTVLETNDLDHLLKVAHPSGDPVADSIFDLIMNKDVSQTFDRSTDALEVIAGAAGATPAQIADAVWDELAGDHTGSTTFGGKNQNNVPSETLNDYKADVSGLATSAALATHDAKLDTVDTVVDAIKAVTDLIPDAGAMNDLALILADTNELQGDWTDGGRLDLILDAVKVDTAAILVDTGTTIPATLAALATAAALAVVDSNVDAILVDTGTTIPATLSGMSIDIDDLTADLEDHDDDIKDDLLDLESDIDAVKTDTETIIATIGGIPVGAITFTYNVTNTVSGNPIADADVWVTTDIAGVNVIASGKTDQFGDVTFYLDAGTVYMWRQKSGFNFENPDTEVVS